MAAGRPGALRVGHFYGVPIYADLSLFIAGALVTVAILPRLEEIDPTIGNRAYLVAAGFAVLVYLSILLHELAHAAVGRAYGLPVRSIALSLLGGVTDLGRAPQSAGRSFAISAAGPATTLVIAGLGYGLLQVTPEGTLTWLVLTQLTASNVIVGVYNLLPGLPLDGGAMLASVVWGITRNETKGIVFAAWAGRGVAVLTAAIPFLAAWSREEAPDPVLIVLALFLSVVLWMGSAQALRAARFRKRLPLLALRHLVRPSIAVPPTTPLAEALRQLEAAGAAALVVVDGTGRATGIVSEAAVSATPVERRPWVATGDVARPLVPGLVLTADLTGPRLIEALEAQPATEYLVVDREGAVSGVLATADVQRVLAQA
jgi:Zn-dependent protease